MEPIHENFSYRHAVSGGAAPVPALISHRRERLAADCSRCCGLCCTALYFSKAEGFPDDKEAGIPCAHLCEDFSCEVHSSLSGRRLKGCINYECFGAGQTATEIVFQGKSWRQLPDPEEMFRVFFLELKLHEAMWYLEEAAILRPASALRPRIHAALTGLEKLADGSRQDLTEDGIRDRITAANDLLKETIRLTLDYAAAQKLPSKKGGILRSARSHSASSRKTSGTNGAGPLRFLGYHFQGEDLSAMDFSSSFLIAADLRGCRLFGTCFLGTDLRDADLKGADLRDAFFLTQMQINAAKGSRDTRLPSWLKLPDHWESGR